MAAFGVYPVIMVDVQVSFEENQCLILIHGEVDASSSIYLDEALQQAFRSEADRILVDCRELHYISSAGLGVFMSYIQELETSNKRLVLFNMSEKVHKVFEILGLHQVLTIVGSQEEAKLISNEL